MNAETTITAAGVPAVYSAINAVMTHVAKEGISKDRKNQQQGYKFRGIDDVYNSLCSVLAENKLIMLPFVVDRYREERHTKGGGVLNYTILIVDFKLVSAVDGSFDTVRMVGEAMDSADKSSNKAQSAAHKYAALQVFMIPTEGDNDADATTHDIAPAAKQRQSRSAGTEKAPATEGMPDAEWSRLVTAIKVAGVSENTLIKEYGVKNLRLLNQAQFADALSRLNDVVAKRVKQETNNRARQEEPSNSQWGDVLDDAIGF